jgi:hypothetical protein
VKGSQSTGISTGECPWLFVRCRPIIQYTSAWEHGLQYISGEFIQCVYSLCSFTVFIQYVYSVCLFSVFIQCVYSVCLFSVFIHCVHSVCSFSVVSNNIQHVPGTAAHSHSLAHCCVECRGWSRADQIRFLRHPCRLALVAVGRWKFAVSGSGQSLTDSRPKSTPALNPGQTWGPGRLRL